jgi:hypothetical protein
MRIEQKTADEAGCLEAGRLETKRNREGEGLSVEALVAIGEDHEKGMRSTDLLERILA